MRTGGLHLVGGSDATADRHFMFAAVRAILGPCVPSSSR